MKTLYNYAVDAVIVANGNFPHHELPLHIISIAPYVVCCDGAANQFLERGYLPNAIVGDGDSISPDNRATHQAILYQIPDQETNDLTKAVRFCHANGLKRIAIVGATGKREDHSLANISLLAEYSRMDLFVVMITDYGVFTVIDKPTTIESVAGQQVSLFAIDNVPITTHGLKYPIHQRVLHNLWEGSLNESLADTFEVVTEGRVIVYQAYPASE